MSENTPPKRRLKSLFFVVLLISLIAASFYWHSNNSKYLVSTSNAYVSGHIVPLDSQTSGTVKWISAEQGDKIKAGQLLVKLDDTDAKNQVKLKEQKLSLEVRNITALRQKTLSLATQVKQIKVSLKMAEDEFSRRKKLRDQAMVSQEELDTSRSKRDELRISHQVAMQKYDESQLLAGTMPIADHPQVKQASVELKAAYIRLSRTNIVAAVSGTVAAKNVHLGQYVETGDLLFRVVQLESSWVEANFKENQLTHLAPGQPVTIISDLYGQDKNYKGKITAIGSGTGAVFSLLPAQNATGNWIKIVQRVPVRVEFEQAIPGNYQLPLGASLQVTVDTSVKVQTLADNEPNHILKTQIYDDPASDSQQKINDIIRSNEGDFALSMAARK
ncbi:efflux RND transporter periplasmic adaptor subunit [Thalassomonas haliotis]|uniref:HlyD family efflux transporter periplasmic adaptor subunit n=1 Tax=Thalassomonas haliotis TaxID=485448 RepID=A0ABY7VEX1_9GAMM|nr:HlyD family efflux transporter periplasmic adaptor subunit [Thalassomonas haliotis]WDE12000.1 HlyD family efflux transporter periplasmic adaptor subunit [Thalassomonas haliotis]